jgi:hypothetical protein
MSVCAIAVWRGRDEERLSAGAVLANWALTLTVFKSRSEDTQWSVFVLDFAVLVLFFWLAMRSERYWLLFATGFQVLLVVTHLAHAVDPAVSGWAYLTASLMWSYLVLLAIGYAAWTAPGFAARVGASRPG